MKKTEHREQVRALAEKMCPDNPEPVANAIFEATELTEDEIVTIAEKAREECGIGGFLVLTKEDIRPVSAGKEEEDLDYYDFKVSPKLIHHASVVQYRNGNFCKTFKSPKRPVENSGMVYAPHIPECVKDVLVEDLASEMIITELAIPEGTEVYVSASVDASPIDWEPREEEDEGEDVGEGSAIMFNDDEF